MKKFQFLFAAVLLFTAAMFTSCDPDEDKPEPTVSITTTAPANGFIVGETVVFTVTATANNVDLESLAVSSSPFEIAATSGLDVADDKIVDLAKATSNKMFDIEKKNTTFTIKYNYVIPAGAVKGNEITVKFTVTDADGGMKVASADAFTVVDGTVVVTAPEIENYIAVMMGGQDNSLGSYLEAITGTVMKQAAAEGASAKVDLIYYFGSTNKATLVAPNDATVGGGDNNLSLAVGLTTKNATVLAKSTLTAAQFTAATAAEVKALTAPTGTKINMLAVNDVIEFKTFDGLKGLIKVTDIETGANGKITLAVKVQKTKEVSK